MRLIDADALRADFHEPNNWLDPEQVLVHITGIWAAIDNAPTVAPTDRKHGKWVQKNKEKWNTLPVYQCSECGDYHQAYEPTWNYCPNCGADMRGEEDE